MCGFCGSRSLRLPWLLRHDILFSCRRGRMSTVAVRRNSLACFSIPISTPIFASSPVFDAYSGLGHFQSFHARCSWDRSFRRAPPPSACLITVDGAGCFYAYYFCGELVKMAPTDAMISNRQSINQSINQCFYLVSSISPSLVLLGGAERLLLALRCLISGRFCIIPVRSGIEHFSRNYAV